MSPINCDPVPQRLPMTLVSIDGWQVIVHGLPTNPLAASERALSSEDRETLLASLAASDRPALARTTWPSRAAGAWKTGHSPAFLAMFELPPNGGSPGCTRERQAHLGRRRFFQALSSRVGCSRPEASDLLSAGYFEVLRRVPEQGNASSSGEPTPSNPSQKGAK